MIKLRFLVKLDAHTYLSVPQILTQLTSGVSAV
jgi:hypothetical protein